MSGEEYDPRYLAGVQFFNRRDFFEAHEVWEEVWGEAAGEERRFYQGLIQAAVALYHFGNGNVRGAAKLYRSGRQYMASCGSPYYGLDVNGFWEQMDRCGAGLLGPGEPDRDLRPDEALMPTIVLDPPPAEWPEPTAFLRDD